VCREREREYKMQSNNIQPSMLRMVDYGWRNRLATSLLNIYIDRWIDIDVCVFLYVSVYVSVSVCVRVERE